jgi:hypothetical protein
MTDDPKPNLDPLRRVLKKIDKEPGKWRQDRFGFKTKCGTAYCVAGHVVAMSKLAMDWIEDLDCAGAKEACKLKDGRYIHDVAQELLGLTEDEAGWLFSAVNSRQDIQEAAEYVAARAGEEL